MFLIFNYIKASVICIDNLCNKKYVLLFLRESTSSFKYILGLISKILMKYSSSINDGYFMKITAVWSLHLFQNNW